MLRMSGGIVLRTRRLVLRRWREEDRVPFFGLNSDPEVTEFLPRALSKFESDELMRRIDRHFDERGFGLCAVQLLDGPLIGFVGLSVPSFTAHFTPCVEIGWRLASDHWQNGYATEAARVVLEHAFSRLDLGEIVSFTTVDNHRSRRVMERLGMTHDPGDDFDHPSLAEGHPLRRHVLYRISLAD
jgi:ribosomal-protein-alanine N-acetyltransferase